jgi:endonuclease/exonuclease/phosphatase family metal-dependent hydrolase
MDRVPNAIRVLTFNLLTVSDAAGPSRQDVVRRTLPPLRPDIVAFQEVAADPDQATDLLGQDFTIVDLPGSGECLAARWPFGAVRTLDQPLSGGMRATAVAAEVRTPLGVVLAVHHRGTFHLDRESVREQQALATARFVEDLLAGRDDVPVVLMGDLNAAPDAASIRFLTGRQSLDGTSVRYEDAWAATHPDDPGHTFTPRNPLVRAGQMPLERGRRIDYVLIRSGPHGPLLDVADCRLAFTDPVDGVWASDHFGVLADLRPPPHPPGQWAESPGT